MTSQRPRKTPIALTVETHPDLGYAGFAGENGYTNQTAAAALARIIKPAGQADSNNDPAIFFVFGHGGALLEPTQMFWTGKQNDPTHQPPLAPDADWYDREHLHRKSHCSFIVETDEARRQMLAYQPSPARWEGWNNDCRWLADPGIPNDAFRRVLLAVFLGCLTGRDNPGWGSPAHGLVVKGARLTVGWVGTIGSHRWAGNRLVPGAEEFADRLWDELCVKGKPLQTAIRDAYDKIPAWQGLTRYHIYGRLEDGSVGMVEGTARAQLRIHPARWGNDPEG